MAGKDLPSLAFAFARFIQRESRCFPRTHRHRAARRRHGLGPRSGPRRRFLARNHRQNRRRGYARHSNHPLHGQASTVHQAGPFAPAAAVNEDIPALHHAGPSAPAVAVGHVAAATPPTAFTIPPMDWLLAGPSTPFLGEEEMFPCELAPPPLPGAPLWTVPSAYGRTTTAVVADAIGQAAGALLPSWIRPRPGSLIPDAGTSGNRRLHHRPRPERSHQG